MSEMDQAPGSTALVEVPHAGISIEMDLARFSDQREVAAYRPSGDYGFARYGGHVYEDIDPRLTGDRWRRTVRLMMTDPVIRGMLFAIEMLIRRAEWQVEPAPDGGDAAQETADFVESCRSDMRVPWEDTLAQVLSFLPYGFAVHEVVLKRRLGEGRVNQQGIRVDASAYDDGRIGWDQWAPRAQSTLTQWVFDDWGQAVAVEQQAPAALRPVVIPLSRCLHFRAGGYWGSPEGASVLTAAYQDWDGIRKIKTTENIGIERDLAGLPTFRIPASYMDPQAPAAAKAAYDEYKRIGVNLRRGDQSVVILPSDVHPETKVPMFDLSLLSTGGQRQIDTTRVIRERTTQMTMSLLADFLTVGHEGSGSYSLSQDKTRLFTTAISAWLDLIANVINQQAIGPLIRINGIDPKLTPKLKPGPLDETDLVGVAAYLKALTPLLGDLNTEDRLALTRHLFNISDWPEITTTAEEMDAAAQEAKDAEQERFEQQLQARQGQPASDGGADKPQPEKPKPAGGDA